MMSLLFFGSSAFFDFTFMDFRSIFDPFVFKLPYPILHTVSICFAE
jgi:hypothetical protein